MENGTDVRNLDILIKELIFYTTISQTISFISYVCIFDFFFINLIPEEYCRYYLKFTATCDLVDV